MGPNPFWTLAHYIVVKWLSISLTYACNIPFGIRVLKNENKF